MSLALSRSKKTSIDPSICSWPTKPLLARWAAPRVAVCCSRVRLEPARPTSPRRLPETPGFRSCSSVPPASNPCTTAQPVAKSALTSSRCARSPDLKAAPSASSRKLTRLRWHDLGSTVRHSPNSKTSQLSTRPCQKASVVLLTNCSSRCSPLMSRSAGKNFSPG